MGTSFDTTSPPAAHRPKRTKVPAMTTASSLPEKRGATPMTELRMEAGRKTLATRRLVAWLKPSPTQFALAAAKPTAMRSTSIPIFSKTTNPVMFSHTLFYGLCSPGAGDRGNTLPRRACGGEGRSMLVC